MTKAGDEKMFPVLAVVIAGAFMVILNNSIINVAVPKLMEGFMVTPEVIQWVLSGYMLAMGVVIPTTGYLSDKWGTQKVFMAGIIIFTLGSLLGTVAWSVGALIAARVIQGLGGGLIMPVSMVIIHQVVPRERLGFALGIWGISAMVAPAVGPTLSGYLLQYYHWHWLFTINLPVSFLGLALAFRFLPQQLQLGKTSLDKGGLVLVTIACLSLLYSLSTGATRGWDDPLILTLLAVALVSLFAFVLWELRQGDPLLDLRLFNILPYTISVIIVGISTMGLFSTIYLIPIFAQSVQHLTPLETGILLIPAAVATAITMPVAGKIYDLAGSRLLVAGGLAVLSLATWQLSRVHLDTTTLYLSGWMAVRGIGLGLTSMPATTAGLTAVPGPKVSRASALTNTLRQLSGALAIALITMIYQLGRLTYGEKLPGGEAAALAIGDAFLVVTILSALAIPLAFYLGDQRDQSKDATA